MTKVKSKKIMFLLLMGIIVCLASLFICLGQNAYADSEGNSVFSSEDQQFDFWDPIDTSENQNQDNYYITEYYDDFELYFYMHGSDAELTGYSGCLPEVLNIPNQLHFGVEWESYHDVTSIKEGIFKDCLGLQQINFCHDHCQDGTSCDDTRPKLKSIGKDTFKGCKNLSIINIPNSVESIGDNAFEGCANSDNININIKESRLKNIGSEAFKGCQNTQSIIIPNSVESIGDNAFEGCTSFNKIDINPCESNLLNIGKQAFKGNDKIQHIELPHKLQNIGEDAFSDCTHLSSIWFYSPTPPTIENYKHCFTADCPIYVHCGGLEAYKEKLPDYVSRITGFAVAGNSIKCFYNDNNHMIDFQGSGEMFDYSIENPAPWINLINEIKFIKFDDCITKIGNYNFSGLNAIDSLILPKSVTCIGVGAFDKCNISCVYCQNSNPAKLNHNTIGKDTDIYVPIGSRDKYLAAWGNQYKYTEVKCLGNCGDNLYAYYYGNENKLIIDGFGDMYDFSTSAHSYAPWINYKIDTIIFGKNMTSIGNSAFFQDDKNNNFTDLTIPSSVGRIGDFAFSKNIRLKNIKFLGNRPYFLGCCCFNLCSFNLYFYSSASGWENLDEHLGGAIKINYKKIAILTLEGYITNAEGLGFGYLKIDVIDANNNVLTSYEGSSSCMAPFYYRFENIVTNSPKIKIRINDGENEYTSNYYDVQTTMLKDIQTPF